MPVERSVLDPDTRRARAVVRVTFDTAAGMGADEIEALGEIVEQQGESYLDVQTRLVREYMVCRGWPASTGAYWSNNDGSRWEAAKAGGARPDWAVLGVRHPAQLYPERSPEKDAFELLWRCEILRSRMESAAPAPELVEHAIRLGMLAGRVSFEARFGRACDVGIGRILSGRKGGRAYADTKEFDRERRIGALRRAIDAAPTAGPSSWARAVKELWPDSDDPEAAARKFYARNRRLLGHEIPLS
jgi:hypothetical protein